MLLEHLLNTSELYHQGIETLKSKNVVVDFVYSELYHQGIETEIQLVLKEGSRTLNCTTKELKPMYSNPSG